MISLDSIIRMLSLQTIPLSSFFSSHLINWGEKNKGKNVSLYWVFRCHIKAKGVAQFFLVSLNVYLARKLYSRLNSYIMDLYYYKSSMCLCQYTIFLNDQWRGLRALFFKTKELFYYYYFFNKCLHFSWQDFQIIIVFCQSFSKAQEGMTGSKSPCWLLA